MIKKRTKETQAEYIIRKEVNTPEVLELARDGHFGAQSCKIRVCDH
jgi:hypothetical protein